MNNRLRIFALTAFCTLALQQTSEAADSPVVSDADALALTKSVALDLQAGRLDRTRLTPKFNALVHGAAFDGLARPFRRLSSPFAIALGDREDIEGVTTRTYILSASDGNEYVTIGIVDATGKISALYARPGAPK